MRNFVLTVAACAGLLAIGCGDGDPGAAADAGPDAAPLPQADAGPDLTGALFDPERVLHISIEMAPADWADLRRETRSLFDVLGSSCLTAPPESPFTWFPASVTIDGETLPGIAVRKKGFFGSLSETKPSLKLDLNEFAPGQSYSGLDNLTLNNNKSDGSNIKQCLGYALFRAAGLAAPRCNFAVVEVNGEALGVYTHVEAVKPQFLRRSFGNDEGNLYEGALSDFRPGWVETFQKKTNETDPDRSDIEALVPILEGPDATLLASLAPYVDVAEFTTLWAMEVLLMHADGYARNTNNFYLYRDTMTGRFHFIPWGIDSIMFPDTALPWENGMAPPTSVWAEGVLARRLYQLPATRDAYRARLQALLDEVWNEQELQAEIDRMQTLIEPYVLPAEMATFVFSVDSVRDFVAGRRAVLEPALAGSPEPWTNPLRDPWCIDAIGTVDMPFTATFDGLNGPGLDPFNDGSSATTLSLPQLTTNALMGGALSGVDADTGNPAILAAAWLEPGVRALVVQVVVDDRLWLAGTTIPIDWVAATSVVATVTFPAGGGDPIFQTLGMVGDGTLQLDQASPFPGAPISGHLVSTIYEPIF